MYCKNHPSVETRVTCSNCGEPICPDCMVFTPVGAKCPGCGHMPKSARVRVKPGRQLMTVAAGLAAAVAGGYLFGIFVSIISFFAFLVAFALGMGIGEAVSWASGRHHGSRLAAWAAACAVFSVLFPFILTGFTAYGASAEVLRYAIAAGGLWKFMWMAVAAFGAWQRNT